MPVGICSDSGPLYFAKVFGRTAVAVSPRYTSQKCSNCGVKVKKSLSVRTHICRCGYSAHRDKNAAINILDLALQARDGQSRSNAWGVAASTLLGETLAEQVATMNQESPRMRDRGVSIDALPFRRV